MSDNAGRQFVDTNVLVYAHDRSAGEKHARARDLMRALWDSGQGCLSVQVLQEFTVTVTGKVTDPIGLNVAAQLVSDLGSWTVHRPGVEDVLDAIRFQARYGVSFWDAMILTSAHRLSCETLWSEDLNAGQVYGDVTVCNPFA